MLQIDLKREERNRAGAPVPTGLHLGDALTVLRTLPNSVAQMCVTSPPYWGLRAYGTIPRVWDGNLDCEHEWRENYLPPPGGKSAAASGLHGAQTSASCRERLEEHHQMKGVTTHFCSRCGAWCGELGLEPTPELYVSHLIAIFAEVRRVLRDDAVCWLVIGDSYARAAGKGQHKPGNSGKQDYIVRVTGRAANQCDLGRCRLKAKDLVGIPWMTAFALREDGWYLRSAIVWEKPNCLPASVKDRPTCSYEHVFLLAKSERYFWDARAIAEPLAESTLPRYARGDSGRDPPPGQPPQRGRLFAWRGSKFTTGKTARRRTQTEESRAMRDKQAAFGNRQYTGFNGRWDAAEVLGLSSTTRNVRDVWRISSAGFKGAHFAVFPREVARRCILAGSRPGDVVLDPFLGSGTSAEVAEELGRQWIGIELNPEYEPLIKERAAEGRGAFIANWEAALGAR